MIILFHRNFTKQLAKLTRQTQEAFDERSALFLENKFHPLLDNHSLCGPYKGKRSINVTGDYRAIFEQKEEVAIFLKIGTHHELYGS